MSDSQTIRTLGVLDTSIATRNTGDHIIMEAAMRELDDIIRPRQMIRFPTHEKLSPVSYRLQRHVEFNIACGTNLLHSHMGLVKQWNVGLRDSFRLAPVVLLGVGWRSQAKRRTDVYTRWLLKRLLSGTHLHSVRDSYTLKQIKDAGIDNVVNTGCPTIWRLHHEHCARIPTGRAKNAVMVLTDYSRNLELDSRLAEFVLSNYDKVYYWCQGMNDSTYLAELGIQHRVTMIPPSLIAYHELLADPNISLDYVGTRLHGGIFALQHGRRSVIVGVDHRANTKGSDFNLPVISRYDDPGAIDRMIAGDFETRIDLPLDAIEKWRSQFS